MNAVKWVLSIFLCFSVLFVTIFGINCVYAYLFPVKFQEEVAAASEESGLDEAIIFSVINVESRFNPNAVSPKGAVGLMQVMPSTAQEIMKNLSTDAKAFLEQNIAENAQENENEQKNGEKDGFFAENLKKPATNIMLGAKYLKSLLERFENLDTALCAYNAGPATVKLWLLNAEYSTDGKTLSKIPYEETRNYLEKFHKNFKYYSAKIK